MDGIPDECPEIKNISQNNIHIVTVGPPEQGDAYLFDLIPYFCRENELLLLKNIVGNVSYSPMRIVDHPLVVSITHFLNVTGCCRNLKKYLDIYSNHAYIFQ